MSFNEDLDVYFGSRGRPLYPSQTRWSRYKRALDLTVEEFLSSPVPLQSLYVLGERLPRGKKPAKRKLSSQEALGKVLKNPRMEPFVRGTSLAAVFQNLVQLVQTVEVYDLCLPTDLEGLFAANQVLEELFGVTVE